MITLYGIKNCDTVKKARNWLEEHQLEYHFHDFREHGLEADQVSMWIKQLGLDALVNKRSTTWKQLDASIKNSLDEKSAVAVILESPTLIKRPLMDTGDSHHVGFKADQYQQLLL